MKLFICAICAIGGLSTYAGTVTLVWDTFLSAATNSGITYRLHAHPADLGTNWTGANLRVNTGWVAK